MFGIVKTINGQKKVIQLTSEARSGNPLGSLICIYSNVVPSGYLPCNGVAFDENQYPALYAMLGDNHTPDLRECTLKMIGENPNGASHVKSGGLAIGEFVDDRLQDHKHSMSDFLNPTTSGASLQYGSGTQNLFILSNTNNISEGRTGATTEVKAVGVNICIKATSGLEESQQDYVLEAILDAGSYSTTEHKTGKKWIDGKDIYEQTFEVDIGVATGTWVDIVNKVSVPDIAKLITHSETWGNNEQVMYASAVSITPSTSAIIRYSGVDTASVTLKTIHLEYTKTTD